METPYLLGVGWEAKGGWKGEKLAGLTDQSSATIPLISRHLMGRLIGVNMDTFAISQTKTRIVRDKMTVI